jgi:hypothetical protein
MGIVDLLTAMLAMDLKWLLLIYALFYLASIGMGYLARNGSLPYILALCIPVTASLYALIFALVKSGLGAGTYGGIVAELIVTMSFMSQMAIIAHIVCHYSDKAKIRRLIERRLNASRLTANE